MEFGEPLDKDEPAAPGEAIAEHFEPEDVDDDAPAEEEPASDDTGAVDFDDWEPTLF